ncbi:serine/threonine protein kinase, partial [bacterium]|nr:serine/threonine protein kinase [bacterium]
MSQTPEIPGYRIISVLGVGAMATVYRAEHLALKRTVALKVMDPAVAEDKEYRERFFREARAAAKLNHRNIVRAIDSGFSNGFYFIAMELVEGDDLRRRIEADGKVKEDLALSIAISVANALDEASRHGVVHRDVKPENILLSKDGTVKLADLGLAKVLDEDGTLTKRGLTVGTVAYFAPEQALGQSDVDVRADLYALGATLYVALSGELPFGRGENAPETMQRILQQPPPALEKIAPWISPSARTAVERLMAKDRNKRPQTARDAVRLLEMARKGEIAPPERRSGRVSTRTSRHRRSALLIRARKVRAAIGTGAALAIVGGVVLLLVAHGHEDASASGGNPRPTTKEPPPRPDTRAAGSPTERALARIFSGRVERRESGALVFDYASLEPASLADFERTGPAPATSGGALVFSVEAGQSSFLRHRAVLVPPVRASFELSLSRIAEPAHVRALLVDESGRGIASWAGARLDDWENGAVSRSLGGAEGVETLFSTGTSRRVEVELGATSRGSLDGSEQFRIDARPPRAGHFGLDVAGDVRAQVRRLRLEGQPDPDWLRRIE